MSVQSIYKAFGNKPALLKTVFDGGRQGLGPAAGGADDGMTMFARALHQEGQLRPDVSVEEAGDMLWTCNSPEVYELLVVQRGWTPERYGRWVADTLTAALLP